MSSIDTDNDTLRVSGLEIKNVGDYLDALRDVLEYPLNTGKLPMLFGIGVTLNAFLSPEAPDGLILLMIVPLCILLGYLGYVGEHVGRGTEGPPNFDVEDVKDYFVTGFSALAFAIVLFMMMTVLLVPAVILGMLITTVGIPMSTINTILVYLFTGGFFILFVYLLPALPIWTRDLQVREVFQKDNIDALFDRTFRREYLIAYLVFLPLAIAMSLGTALGMSIPIVGFLIGAALSFYFQLAWMKAAGHGYFS